MGKPSHSITKFSETRLILAIGGLYALMQILTFARIYAQMEVEGYEASISVLIQERVVALSIAFLYITIIVKTTKRFLLENRSWRRIILTHLFFAMLVSFLWYSTFILVTYLICFSGNCDQKVDGFLLWYLFNFDKLFLLYLITVSVTYTYYYVQRDTLNEIQKSQIQNQLLQTRLKMLQSQLEPHFLFNTLNSIACLVDLDIKKAKSMIADLGDLLRHVLDQKDVHFVTVNEEIQLLEKYINIEKTRFTDDLDIQMLIHPEIKNATIPSMLLQPLVENAIRHGFSRHHPTLKIQISLSKMADQLCIEIKDDGVGLRHQNNVDIFEQGTGLKNTYERLQSTYGNNFSFSVENLSPGVENQIKIPLKFDTIDWNDQNFNH